MITDFAFACGDRFEELGMSLSPFTNDEKRGAMSRGMKRLQHNIRQPVNGSVVER
jgi:hypothetical protein